VYFDLFWHLANPHLGVHVVEGTIKGALAHRFDE